MVNQSFDLSTLTPEQKQLRLEILQLSYEQKYSHLGSCLTAVDAISAVYQVKKPNDIFILSNGHAGVAWYVVLKKLGLISADQIKTLNIHPDRNPTLGIEVSTGSLGQGLPIAAGMALADPTRTIYCMISDGECAEGSIWESLRIVTDQHIKNLVVLLNANGWGAYDQVKTDQLISRIKAFGWEIRENNGHQIEEIKTNLSQPIFQPTVIVLHTTNNQLPFLADQDAHYYVMTDQDWQSALELLT
jgi:transketolase